MQTLTLPAPAKLNLMLHIVGRRADGYHELQTLFQFLDHGDELSFRLRADGEIRLHIALPRSEEHTSELQSLMRISYAVFCLKKKITYTQLSNLDHNSSINTIQ